MELKPGYKQTEVGVIPEEWEVKLANRCEQSSTLLDADECYSDEGVANGQGTDIGDTAYLTFDGHSSVSEAVFAIDEELLTSAVTSF